MKYLQRIKLLACLLLMVSFFLPISRCAVKEATVYQPPVLIGSEEVKEVTPMHKVNDTKGNNKAVYHYPYKMLSFDELSCWAIFLSFFWPIPILFYCWFGKNLKIIISLKLIEPIACLGAGYVIYSLSFFGEIMYGGYIALASITSYFIASCIDSFFIIRNFIPDKWRTNA